MTPAFALEVEFLTGVYRAALPDNSAAEWPPHPERVFSALVQAWGEGRRDPVERDALAWLEGLDAPWIEADRAEECGERDSPAVYVPANDVRGDEPAALPAVRSRHERSFRAIAPGDPLVRFGWSNAMPTSPHQAALTALAERVVNIGHSASVVRCAFLVREPDERRLWMPSEEGAEPLRVPHAGRLDRLEEWWHHQERPRPGMTVRYRPPSDLSARDVRKSLFGGPAEWFVFEEIGGVRPDLLAFPHVAKAARAALMELGPQPAAAIVAGHGSDGGATKESHLAVVPLANVGWDHSTGDLLGFAVVVPRHASAEARAAAVNAIAAFARAERGDEAAAELRLSSGATWFLQHVAGPSRLSLRPARWCRLSSTWASATPVFLDRFPDRADAVEEAASIAAACRNIGLPEPVEIEIHKHSAVEGSPSAYGSGRLPRGTGWSFPRGSKFASRPRRHVVLRFEDRVEGPVILGAGRFHGMGLCLPLNDVHDGR